MYVFDGDQIIKVAGQVIQAGLQGDDGIVGGIAQLVQRQLQLAQLRII